MDFFSLPLNSLYRIQNSEPVPTHLPPNPRPDKTVARSMLAKHSDSNHALCHDILCFDVLHGPLASVLGSVHLNHSVRSWLS